MVQCALGKPLATEPKHPGMALTWKGWPLAGVTGLRGSHVPVGAWKMQLSEIDMFGAGCQSPAHGSEWTSSLLAAFREFLFGCSYKCLGENESPILKPPFLGVSIAALPSVWSRNSVSGKLNGVARGIPRFHWDAVSVAQWITKL